MKIDSFHTLQRPTQTDVNKATQPSPEISGSTAVSQASVAHLSNKAQDSTQDIDTARVAEIRQAISDGSLEIRPERIADGLLDSVRDLLGDTDA